MTRVFIAGSRNISRLNDQISERLENIVNSGYMVLVGDANGADKSVQTYLRDKQYDNVTVYCSGNNCRNNVGGWQEQQVSVSETLSGLKFYMVKDRKMAEDSNYGFMLWDGKSAGTISNVIELLKLNKSVLVYFAPEKKFYTISKLDNINELLEKCEPDLIEVINKKINIKKSIMQLSQQSQLAMSI